VGVENEQKEEALHNKGGKFKRILRGLDHGRMGISFKTSVVVEFTSRGREVAEGPLAKEGRRSP